MYREVHGIIRHGPGIIPHPDEDGIIGWPNIHMAGILDYCRVPVSKVPPVSRHGPGGIRGGYRKLAACADVFQV